MTMSLELRVKAMVKEIDPESPPNLPLLRKVFEHISSHPEEWYQGTWQAEFAAWKRLYPDHYKALVQERQGVGVCDTAYCFAGHAVVMTEGIKTETLEPASGRRWSVAANDHLGLTVDQGALLYRGSNSLDDIRGMLSGLFEALGEEL